MAPSCSSPSSPSQGEGSSKGAASTKSSASSPKKKSKTVSVPQRSHQKPTAVKSSTSSSSSSWSTLSSLCETWMPHPDEIALWRNKTVWSMVVALLAISVFMRSPEDGLSVFSLTGLCGSGRRSQGHRPSKTAAITSIMSVDNTTEPAVKRLVETTCGRTSRSTSSSSSQSSSAWPWSKSTVTNTVRCHADLVVTQGRQVMTRRRILPGETLFSIPRSWQLRASDALVQEPLFRQEPWLLQARIGTAADKSTDLPGSAWLAFHVARLYRQRPVDLDPVWKNWLDLLPTHQDLLEKYDHPLLWSEEDLRQQLGSHTTAYQHVQSFRRMIQFEYQAMMEASLIASTSAQAGDHPPTPMDQILSWEEYQTARLWVWTRSLATPASAADADTVAKIKGVTTNAWTTETTQLAMVPLVDLLDHHPQSSAILFYDTIRGAYQVKASSRGLARHQPVRVHYIDSSDSKTWAKYGFVNGDGTGPTQASLALFHEVNLNPEYVEYQQRIVDPHNLVSLTEYLRYDDGYDHCVGDPASGPSSWSPEEKAAAEAAWNLKVTKYQRLFVLAHQYDAWHVSAPVRNRGLVPPPKQRVQEAEKGSQISGLEASASSIPTWPTPQLVEYYQDAPIYDTCRLISLTHEDYGGDAFRLLRSQLLNVTYRLPVVLDDPNNGPEDDEYDVADLESLLGYDNHALEYRTLKCVERMTTMALDRFDLEIHEMPSWIDQWPEHSRNWTLGHVRYGEMATLDGLLRATRQQLESFDDIPLDDPAYRVRDRPCPHSHLSSLPNYLRSNNRKA